MKKLFGMVAMLGVVALLASGCDNYRARHWGGSMTINLPPGQKLKDVTWEETHLWYLTRPMQSNEVAETSILQEKSSAGIFQGKITFIESK